MRRTPTLSLTSAPMKSAPMASAPMKSAPTIRARCRPLLTGAALLGACSAAAQDAAPNLAAPPLTAPVLAAPTLAGPLAAGLQTMPGTHEQVCASLEAAGWSLIAVAYSHGHERHLFMLSTPDGHVQYALVSGTSPVQLNVSTSQPSMPHGSVTAH
ncbi:hypothetical protein [Deinococcus aquaticus]|uniref:PepSY domain-containing protein n=1 Tax=Deinococcus aquaticus TaxID=328692 RepID=A0ABY7V126_9DEIO|nr:hypothetical protein [Deinococcus aquaticus]WDA58830.1 hypothetical protein M8445_01020 [Deinococcus aquaticus]